jgi:DNA helicase IV
MVDLMDTAEAASGKRAKADSYSSEDKPADEGGVERMVILETLLKGGFTQGTWRFFWDPEQTIFDYAHKSDERKEAMRRALEQYLGSNFTSVPLHQNCRNTRQIGNAAARVLRLPQSEYLPSSVEGLKVECRVYTNDDEQVRQLHDCLAALKAQGVHDWHITILSWLTYEKSIVSTLQGFVVRDLARYKTIPQNLTNIGFSTVGRYKGLENHFIIVTDIQDGRFRTKQLYVAMTRAKTHLCLLVGAKRSAELVPLLAPTL